MLRDAHPATPDPRSSLQAWEDFRVHQAGEKLTLLCQLQEQQVPVHLTAPGGAALSTQLWAVDAEHGRISFSAPTDDPQLGRLLDAEEWVAVAYLESVMLQFDLGGGVLVRGHGSCALQAELPDEIYRFQRRQAFRVRAADSATPQALLRHPSIPEMQLALRVLDISAGGCALWLPQDVPPLQAGTALGEVRIVLDDATRFAAAMTLQHVTGFGDTGRGVRLGCAWQPLGGAAERSLQRWIVQAQKRQRLLTPRG